MRFYRKIGQFDTGRPFEPYLLRSVVNAALNSTRRLKQQVPFPSGDDPRQVEQLLSQAASVESEVDALQLKQKIIAAGETVAIGTESTFYAKVIVGAGGSSPANAPALAQSLSPSMGSPAVSIGDVNIHCKYNHSENAVYVQELASLINQPRGKAGLSVLNLNPLLTQATQGHSVDMAFNNFLGHEGSDGSRFGTLVHAVGYPFSFQEIIAIGTPQAAISQWSADAGHWEIVLNALATEMGIGYAYNADSNFGGYFTVDIH